MYYKNRQNRVMMKPNPAILSRFNDRFEERALIAATFAAQLTHSQSSHKAFSPRVLNRGTYINSELSGYPLT